MWPIVIAQADGRQSRSRQSWGAQVLFRLYHIEAPLVDGMPMKQVAIANKAQCRGAALCPFSEHLRLP